MDTMTRIFGLDLQLLQDVLLTGLAIFILFFVLSYLLFNPVRAMLEKRKKKISDELDEAETSLRNAEAMKAEYDAKMENVEAESREILDAAQKNALHAKNEILNEAKEDAAAIRKKALAEIEQEKAHARDDMKNEMVTVAAALAEKAVSGAMSPEISDALVDETLKQIGEDTWQGR